MSDLQRPKRSARKKAPSMAPLYGAIGIAILAILAVAIAQKDKDARADAAKQTPTSAETSNPFADVPPGGTAVPSPFDSSGSSAGLPSAKGLLAAPIWTEALASTEKAKGLLVQASEADRLGDRPTYKAKALAARKLFNGALENTAKWEFEISEAHGEADAQVAKIRSLRAVWFEQVKKLRMVDVNDI